MTIETYQIFNQSPNWQDGVSMRYSMLTSLLSSQRYKEQRKAMRDVPVRTQSFNIFLDGESPQILNYLITCLQKVMYVPIFTEKVIGQSTGANLSTIDTSDTSYLFNLKSLIVRLVAILDSRDQSTVKIATLTGVIVDAITITPIAFDYEAGFTIIYPTMPAILTSMQKVFESAKMSTYKLVFDEFIREDSTP